MFQHPLREAIRRAQSTPFREPCLHCQCACGRVIPRKVSVTQKRFARRAPAVRAKQNAREDVRLAGSKPLAARLAELDEARLEQMLKQYTTCKASTCADYASFATRFAAQLSTPAVKTTPYDKSSGPVGSDAIVDARTLRQLQEEYKYTDIVVAQIGMLLRHLPTDDYLFLGNALHYSAANAGNEWAVVVLADNALQSMKHMPDVFKYTQTARVRKQLHEIASTGKNYRAAILAGKLTHEEGDTETGIRFLRLAMDGAVEASEQARRARILKSPLNTDSKTIDEFLAGSSLADLSAPWVELGAHYIGRKDWANAKWAIEIGCQQDDPNSHLQASLFEKDSDAVRSRWFHHISKAATSGYVRAMHDLGLWYARAGWPYLADEPPDDIKPTPFDKYPPTKHRDPSDGPSAWQRLSVSLGLSSSIAEKPAAQTFHSAAYPTTPKERFNMALEWLKIAMGFYYAPSYLATATLLLEKQLYAEAATPKEALKLSNSRYSYASEKAYNNNEPLDRPDRQYEEIENPFYDPEEAKRLTREIFYAATALEITRHNARKKLRRKVGSLNATKYEQDLGHDMGFDLKKWFRYPEVRDLFMDDRTGKLVDRERNDIDLLEDAKRICEEQHWDIYGEDGSLMYRHGMRKQHSR
jgi:hypothetical protein